METDIGSPIDYKPTIEPPSPPPPPDANATSTPIEETVQEPTREEWDQYMHQQAMLAQQQGYYEPPEKKDVWSSVDKTMIIAMFVALIVGFFLGSSRQPVFLKYN